VNTAEDPAVQLALAEGLLSPAELAAALLRYESAPAAPGARPRLLAFLVAERALDGEGTARLLAQRLRMPLADLTVAPAPDALAAVPRALAERHLILPLARNGAMLRVAVGDPFDFEGLDAVGHAVALALEAAIAPLDGLRQAIARHYGPAGPAPDAVPPAGPPATGVADDEAPVIRWIEDHLRQAVDRRASDLHFEPLASRFRVRFRIDGVLHEAAAPPRPLERAVVSRLKLMAGMSLAEKRRPQDGRARLAGAGRELDLRVSALPTIHGESVVIRVLDPARLRLGLGELGLEPDDRRALDRLLALPDGLVLVTGPTGSGKTTTLYACLQTLNHPDRKIITVEDPVEYQLTGINQVPVRPELGLTFAAALRAMLRQSPNVIMVGEIRDRETAEIAIHAALTGHLVFSTLHTNDAAGAVTRLADLGVKPFLVASALRAVVAQRLVRRICPHCARPVAPPPELAPAAGDDFRRGEGCPACERTGYRGCLGLFEVLPVDDELQQLIYAGAGAGRLRAHTRSRGRGTLRADGWRKARAGRTSVEEVLAATVGDANGT